ncbi:MAG: carboxymuconolactone decarboxylase family protein [Candidatus Latescibacteria bacterium]|nr:carboxymuconolactone decarboxylase family protein [Candidatus Latescibacterota bacterium]
MIDKKAFDKGLKLLKKMTGERLEEVRRSFQEADPDFDQYVVGFVAGDIWARGGLDLKTRSLCTIAAVTALGRPSALNLNIHMALENGATEEEIVEVMFQMGVYAGFPACWEGLQAAKRVFAERKGRKGRGKRGAP